MIKTKYKGLIKECRYIFHRILLIKIQSNEKVIKIIGIYALWYCEREKNKEDFCDKLQTIVDRRVQKNDQLICMGDFNARIEDVMPGMKLRFNENTSNKNGERLVDWWIGGIQQTRQE